MRRKHWAAFEEFAQQHGDALVRLSFALCGDRGKAEDATQEALTRVYLRWGRLREPLPYARRCVVNATRDQWRHLSRREERERIAAGEPIELPVLFDETLAERDRLVRALRRLPYGQRAVIVLRFWHQLSERETAYALGNSVGTVKSQTSKALARLRADLAADLLPVAPELLPSAGRAGR
ncbi:MAG TPA: SigE family RNA polymerase sigma factor [Streptosporangiaceae bacterium]|jgi:RNA polymerase sigma-70 factor (sigma-E family)